MIEYKGGKTVKFIHNYLGTVDTLIGPTIVLWINCNTTLTYNINSTFTGN